MPATYVRLHALCCAARLLCCVPVHDGIWQCVDMLADLRGELLIHLHT